MTKKVEYIGERKEKGKTWAKNIFSYFLVVREQVWPSVESLIVRP